jgi:hypothetical protein
LANAAAFQTARDFEITYTIVTFRRGRLVGRVTVTRVDNKDVTVQVIAASEKLDKRILAVLEDHEAVAEQRFSAAIDKAGLDLLREAQARMGAVRIVRVQQRQTVRAGEDELDYELDMRIEFPDKVHVRSLYGHGGLDFEIASLGQDVFINDGGGWSCLDAAGLDDLEISLPAFTPHLDFAAVADRVFLLSGKKVDGESVRHVKVQTTAEEYLEQAPTLLGVPRPRGQSGTGVKGGNAAIDLYIGDDALVRQLRIDLDYFALGEKVSVSNTVLFSAYDNSFRFPLQPPYPSCSGKRA